MKGALLLVLLYLAFNGSDGFPALTGFFVPPVNVSTSNFTMYALVSATNTTRIQIEVSRPGNGSPRYYAFPVWTSTNPNNTYTGGDFYNGTHLRVKIGISFFYNVTKGLYDLVVRVKDIAGTEVIYDTWQLESLGFSSKLNVGPLTFTQDFSELVCDKGPFDVANGPANVSCLFKLGIPLLGISSYRIEITRNGTLPNYYDFIDYWAKTDFGSEEVYVENVHIFTLPQFAPYGNYTLTATARGYGWSYALTSVATIFVKKTINDMFPPVLTGFYVPPFLPDFSENIPVVISVADDASGLDFVSVYIAGAGASGSSYWSNTSPNLGDNRVLSNLSLPVTMTVWDAISGTYAVEIRLFDRFYNRRELDAAQIAALGFPSNITIADKKYYIKSSLTGLVATAGALLDVVVMATKNNSNPNQLWRYNITAGGFVQNVATGHVMDIQSGSTSPNANVISYTKKSGYVANQQWKYNTTTLVFSSKAANLVLDVKNGSTKPNTPLIVYTPKPTTSNQNQRFVLEEYLG